MKNYFQRDSEETGGMAINYEQLYNSTWKELKAQKERSAALKKALEDILEEIPENPKLPMSHAIQSIAKEALKQT